MGDSTGQVVDIAESKINHSHSSIPATATATVNHGQELNPSKQAQDNRIPFSWMARQCHIYKEEYKDCKSIKSRFHQYFLGETRDCTQWKTDYDRCLKWEKDNDMDALERLIDSEKERVRKRLQAHYANDVWERRESPPENWNSDLPEFISKEYKNSYLHVKAEEIRTGEVNMDDIFADSRQLKKSCTIC